MWTELHRKTYERVGARYPSDMTDGEWARLEPLIPAAKPGGRPRTTNMREAINAILYLLRTGCPWRYLPRDGFRRVRSLQYLPQYLPQFPEGWRVGCDLGTIVYGFA